MRPAPTEEKPIYGMTRYELSRARRMTPERQQRWIKYVQLCAHRRWCVINSEGVIVLATSLEVLDVLDVEGEPPAYWLERYAHQVTSSGYHLYIPQGSRNGTPTAWQGWWPSSNESKKYGLAPLIDRKYRRLTSWRRYAHERPREQAIVVPPKMYGDPPGWRETLRLHQLWHYHAVDVAKEYGQEWPS